MGKEKQNRKLDLLWIIAEILGGFAFILAGAYHIKFFAPLDSSKSEIMGFLFGMGLVFGVIKIGLTSLEKGLKELQKVNWRKKKK